MHIERDYLHQATLLSLEWYSNSSILQVSTATTENEEVAVHMQLSLSSKYRQASVLGHSQNSHRNKLRAALTRPPPHSLPSQQKPAKYYLPRWEYRFKEYLPPNCRKKRYRKFCHYYTFVFSLTYLFNIFCNNDSSDFYDYLKVYTNIKENIKL